MSRFKFSLRTLRQPGSGEWLAGAYLAEGAKLFAADDPKYLAFIKSKLQPPPNYQTVVVPERLGNG